MKKNAKILLFSTIVTLFIILLITFRPVQIGGGNYYFIVSSGSMEPTLNTGDWIVCSRVRFDEVKVGDIIAVQHPTENFLVVHRVAEKGEDYLTTKGDVCDATDNFVTHPQNILAKYTGFKIPKFGFLLHFTRTLPGLILVYYVPCAIIITLQVRRLYKRRKEESDQDSKRGLRSE